MERDLKVLLTVDDNSYKITIKTRAFANAVPFSEFKHFLDDKHRQLFHDVNYVWKIYDADFGEFVTLENTSMIYDLSKIKAIRDESRLQANVNTNAGNYEHNRSTQNYAINQNYPKQNQMPIDRRDIAPQQPQRMAQIDLRDFVASSFRSPQVNNTQNPVNANTFDSYYPNRLPLVPPLVQNFLPPVFTNPEPPRGLNFRRSSPPRTDPFDPHSSGASSGFSPFELQTMAHSSSFNSAAPRGRTNAALDLHSHRLSSHDVFSRSSKRHKSPEPTRTPSYPNRNRVLSTPLYLKRSSTVDKKAPPRPVPKLMKSASPIRERSKKLSEASKRFLHQRLTAAAAERKLPVKVSKTTVVAKDSKSPKQTKPLPNCVRTLDPKRRDYFKVEDKQLGKALINAVKKYNEEFVTIAVCEDIWETNRIWTYIAKELSTASEVYLKPTRKAIRCRRYFRGMLRRYLIILEDFWNWSEFEAQELWPFFDFFHKQLNLTPFDKNVTRLKECFTKKLKPVKQENETKTKTESESKAKQKPEKKQFVFDEKYDMRLLMAVSEHIEDFRKDTILESDVWTEVAVDLNEPPILDPTLLEKSRLKWETRFYLLLSEFQKLTKKETTLSSNERTLKFLFDKLDISPFVKDANESDEDSDDDDDDPSILELEKEMLVEPKHEVVDLDVSIIDEKKVIDIDDNIKKEDVEMKDVSNETDENRKTIDELTIDEASNNEVSECLKEDAFLTNEEMQGDVTQNDSADVNSDIQVIEEGVNDESKKEIDNSNENICENQGIAECKVFGAETTKIEIKKEEEESADDVKEKVEEVIKEDFKTAEVMEKENDTCAGDASTDVKLKENNKIIGDTMNEEMEKNTTAVTLDISNTESKEIENENTKSSETQSDPVYEKQSEVSEVLEVQLEANNHSQENANITKNEQCNQDPEVEMIIPD